MQTKSSSPFTCQMLRAGTLVRLQQSFKPNPRSLRTYTYGIVAGLVDQEPVKGKKSTKPTANLAAATPLSAKSEVILSLYDPVSLMPYIDEFGDQALFSFKVEEIELLESNH